jgi:dihydropteridine reductase
LLDGKISDPDFFQKYQAMYDMNVTPSLFAAHLATKYLKTGGFLMLTGADHVYTNPAPEMLSYALAKNLVHSLGYNLSKSKSIPGNVITILP